MNGKLNKGNRAMMRRCVSASIVVIAVATALFAFFAPVGPKKGTEIIGVGYGATAEEVAGELKSKRFIRSETAFRVYARVTGVEKRIKAGDYEISGDMSVPEILRRLKKGSSRQSCFTVQEGLTVEQTARLLEKKGFANADRFVALANDGEFVSRLGLKADSLEGYLFPETYCASKGAGEERILEMMYRQFEKRIAKVYGGQAAGSGLSIRDALTIASVIEKEAAAREERPMVSAVFHNRLKLGMPLQSCATVIYALGRRYAGGLTKEDLKYESEFNTYLHRGLPPGPICSPGESAFRAAVNPDEVDYLYFVSTNNGRHQFSSTLDEHNLAVFEYQAVK